MPLIKNSEFVTDTWQKAEGNAEFAKGTKVIVSFEHFLDHKEDLLNSSIELGIAIANDVDVLQLEPYVDNLALIALNFPKFADGRAYSQARIIREQLGFEGELRATGDVLPDQAVSMLRCGFDSFEVSDKVILETWNKAVSTLNAVYQRSYATPGDSVRIDD